MKRHDVSCACIAFFLIACSDGPGGGTDAQTDAPDADDGLEVEAPTPPEPPAPPVFTPCPDGWREVEDPDTGIVTCDPWPEDGPEDCGPDDTPDADGGDLGCAQRSEKCDV